MNTIEKIGVAIAAVAIVGGVAYYASSSIPGSSAFAPALDVFVSSSERASDDNDGLTRETPVRSLERAIGIRGVNSAGELPIALNIRILGEEYEVVDSDLSYSIRGRAPIVVGQDLLAVSFSGDFDYLEERVRVWNSSAPVDGRYLHLQAFKVPIRLKGVWFDGIRVSLNSTNGINVSNSTFQSGDSWPRGGGPTSRGTTAFMLSLSNGSQRVVDSTFILPDNDSPNAIVALRSATGHGPVQIENNNFEYPVSERGLVSEREEWDMDIGVWADTYGRVPLTISRNTFLSSAEPEVRNTTASNMHQIGIWLDDETQHTNIERNVFNHFDGIGMAITPPRLGRPAHTIFVEDTIAN